MPCNLSVSFPASGVVFVQFGFERSSVSGQALGGSWWVNDGVVKAVCLTCCLINIAGQARSKQVNLPIGAEGVTGRDDGLGCRERDGIEK